MTTDGTKDHAGVKFPPPLLYIGLSFIGVGLDYVYPLSIGIDKPLSYLGYVVFLAAIVAIMSIARSFKKADTNIEPWKSTSKIITTGYFKYSRNPVYLLACGIPIGLGIAYNSYWVVLAFIPCLIIVYYLVVKKEEKYLETKFGQEYLDYKTKVRRWL